MDSEKVIGDLFMNIGNEVVNMHHTNVKNESTLI